MALTLIITIVKNAFLTIRQEIASVILVAEVKENALLAGKSLSLNHCAKVALKHFSKKKPEPEDRWIS